MAFSGSMHFATERLTPNIFQDPDVYVFFGDNTHDIALPAGARRVGIGGQAGGILGTKFDANGKAIQAHNHERALGIPTCKVVRDQDGELRIESLLPNGNNSTAAEIKEAQEIISKAFDKHWQTIRDLVSNGIKPKIKLPSRETNGQIEATIGMGIAEFDKIPEMRSFMNTKYAKTRNLGKELNLDVPPLGKGVPQLTNDEDKLAAREALEKLAKRRPKEAGMLRDNLSKLSDKDKKILAEKIETFCNKDNNTNVSYQNFINELMSLDSFKNDPKLADQLKKEAEDAKKLTDKELSPEELQRLIDNYSKFKGLCKKEAVTEIGKSGFDWLAEMTDPTKAPDAPFQQFHLLKILFFLPLFLVCKGASKTLGHLNDHVKETQKILAGEMNLPELDVAMDAAKKASEAKAAATTKEKETPLHREDRHIAKDDEKRKKDHSGHHLDKEAFPEDPSGRTPAINSHTPSGDGRS
jgi:hypothetical protein